MNAIPAPLAQRPTHGAGVRVTVLRTEGSVPREALTWMWVAASDGVMGTGGTWGTIGGGHLELAAIETATQLAKGSLPSPHMQRTALGPSLGQCCGGVVWLHFEAMDAQNAMVFDTKNAIKNIAALAQSTAIFDDFSYENEPQILQIALFGGGHVGQAIVRQLALLQSLPLALSWVDSRGEVFPPALLAHAPFCQAEHSEPPQAAVPSLAAGSQVLIMSFSHAEDLEIVASCLKRQRERGDLPFVGLIGSKTKWATFRSKLAARGFTEAELAHVTCPIGAAGIDGKEPEVIALAVAAQLLANGPPV